PMMARAETLGPIVPAAVMTRQRADRGRLPGRSRQNSARLGQRLACGPGKKRMAVDAAGLALVGRHAKRRVALEKLNRVETLLYGEIDVLIGDVVLVINE